MRSRLRLAIAVAAAPLVLWAVLPVLSSGAPTSAALRSKIEAKRDAIQPLKGRERVLSSDVAGFSQRIGTLQADITVLQTRQVRLQGSLNAKLAELARVQERLRSERLRLVRLRARLAEARTALAARLVEIYKSDHPDVVTVVLESDGFADLLEQTEFMQRVSHQDARIIGIVKTARAEATRTAERLKGLEARAEKVAAEIQAQRDQVASVKGELVDRRTRYEGARSQKASLLASTREHRQDLEGDLVALEREQAAVTARLQAAQGGGGSQPAGPVRQGSGALIWPVNGSIASGFGMRWGRLHAGIDIPAPEGTPIRAAAGGRVVIAGWTGGYGNYTCIQHSGSLSTCYGHQVRLGTSVGATVSQGQVMGYVGNTGHSFGAHLHFETRINGAPVDPMGYL